MKNTKPTDGPTFTEFDNNSCFGDLTAAIYAVGDLLTTLDIKHLHRSGEIKSDGNLQHYLNLQADAVESFEVAEAIFDEIRRNHMANSRNALSEEWTFENGELTEGGRSLPEEPELSQIEFDDLFRNF